MAEIFLPPVADMIQMSFGILSIGPSPQSSSVPRDERKVGSDRVRKGKFHISHCFSYKRVNTSHKKITQMRFA